MISDEVLTEEHTWRLRKSLLHKKSWKTVPGLYEYFIEHIIEEEVYQFYIS